MEANSLDMLDKTGKAQELGVSIRTLDRWVEQGKIQFYYLPDAYTKESKTGRHKRWFYKQTYGKENQ